MLRFTVTDKSGEERELDNILTVVLDSDKSVPADSLTVTLPFDNKIRLGAEQIRAYDGDKAVFVGRLDNITSVESNRGVILKLNARSLAAALLDNEAEPVTYINPAAPLIGRRHLLPFGIRLEGGDGVPYYNSLKIDKGASHWQVVQSFCRNRYQCEPRITGDGRAILDGSGKYGFSRFSNTDGIPYYGLKESRMRHKLISEVRLKFQQTNTYSSVIRNQNPDAARLTRVRYINAAADKTTPATADKMLDSSNRASYSLHLYCGGCLTSLLGNRAEVWDAALGRIEGLVIEKVRYTVGRNGERSEITLKKERFDVADEIHNK